MKRSTFVLIVYAVVALVAATPVLAIKYEQYKSDDRLERTGSRMCYADGSELDLTSSRSEKLEAMSTQYCK